MTSRTETSPTSPAATQPERIVKWKVRTTARGVELIINGKTYWTESGESLAFDIDHAARGWNAPEVERTPA
jgi:hypothetical protein